MRGRCCCGAQLTMVYLVDYVVCYCTVQYLLGGGATHIYCIMAGDMATEDGLGQRFFFTRVGRRAPLVWMILNCEINSHPNQIS